MSEPLSALSSSKLRVIAASLPGLKAAVLADEDPEAVHDLRVAIRRLRAGLLVFGPFLPARVRKLEAPLHDLFEALGRVREFDLAIATATKLAPDPEAARGLTAALAAAQGCERLTLTVSLAKDGIVEHTVSALQSPARCQAAEKETVATELPEIVRRLYRKTRSEARKLTTGSPPEDTHRLRRRVKRLRYVVELFADEYGKPARRFVDELTELQDRAGKQLDVAATARILRTLNEVPGESLSAREDVVTRLSRRFAKLRSRTVQAAGDFEDGAWRRLRKAMRNASRESH